MAPTTLDLVCRRLGPFLAGCHHATVLELGAYDGRHAAALRALLPDDPAAWIACECDPRNILQCEVAPIYRLPGMRLLPVAVSDRDGSATLHLSTDQDRDWSESSSIVGPTPTMAQKFPWLEYRDQVDVPTRSLDSIGREYHLGTVDLLFSDVEGAEGLVLAGGKEVLARTRYFFTEVWHDPIYRGMLLWPELRKRLGAKWEIVEYFPGDVLLHHHDPRRRRIVALTSLIPGQRVDVQRRALASWRRAGLEIHSLNHRSELDRLRQEHPEGVTFTAATTELERLGRHYVRINTLIEHALEHRPGATLAILNSDCELEATPGELERLGDLAGDGILGLIRWDYPAGHPADAARTDRAGIDGFLFGPRLARRFAPSWLCLGQTAWDYWLPIATRQLELPVRTCAERILLHELHDQRWSLESQNRTLVELDRLCRHELTAAAMYYVLMDPALEVHCRPTCNTIPHPATTTEPRRAPPAAPVWGWGVTSNPWMPP